MRIKPYLLVLVGMGASRLAAQVSYQVPVHTGQHLPGMPDGSVLSGIYWDQSVGDGGEIPFEGSYYLGTTPVDTIWQYSPASGIKTAAANGTPVAIAPLSSGTLTDINGFGVSSASSSAAGGHMLFTGTVHTSASSNSAVLVGLPGSVKAIAQQGKSAPGGSTFSDFNLGYLEYNVTAINPHGEVAFAADLADGRNGIFVGDGNTIDYVARTGDSAPGTGGGTFAGFAGDTLFPINANGDVVFSAYSSAGQGIWMTQNGARPLRLVALQNQPVPSLGAGVQIGTILFREIDANGTIGFVGTLTGAGMNSSNNEALFVGPPTAPSIVLRTGSPAPGIAGATVSYFEGYKYRISSSNHLALHATLLQNSLKIDSILAGTPQYLSVVARDRQHAPGTPDGVVFGTSSYSVFEPVPLGDFLWMNSNGQVAFTTGLQQDGVPNNPNNPDRGIWAMDPFGDLVKVVRVGDTITSAEVGTSTVSKISFRRGTSLDGGPEDGEQNIFNAANQLTFTARLTAADGSNVQGIVLTRVGGAARMSNKPPIYGAAATNGYGATSPIRAFQPVSITGDTGFVQFGPHGSQFSVLLDFNGSTSGIDAAMTELTIGQDIYGYSVSRLSSGPYDAIMSFTGLTPSDSQFFYWNFLNIPGVDLTQVQLVPEPSCAMAFLITLPLTLIRNRRPDRAGHASRCDA